MSERKLYEIGMRMVGILILLRALSALTGAIMYVALGTGSDPMYAAGGLSASLTFLVLFSAGVLLLALAPRLAVLICPRPESLTALPALEPGIILPAGLIFIGVVSLGSGIASLAQVIPEIVNWLRYEPSYTMSVFVSSPLPAILSAAARALVGLILIFHGQLFPRLRKGWEAVIPVRDEAHSDESEDEETSDSQA